MEAFRQGRCHQIERKLHRPVVVFAQAIAKVGVFLPNGPWSVESELLEACWTHQGAPLPHLPTENETVLFGKIYTMEVIPFAGYDDVWLEGDTLHFAQRRAKDAVRLQQSLQAFKKKYLLDAAQRLTDAFAPRLSRAPSRVLVYPLRPRILGQCTREGEIRLNLSLLQWPIEILEETLAHELTHLVEFNHSTRFWRALTALLPDWLPRSLVHYLS